MIHDYCKPTDHILMLGCGNSILSEQMYDQGFTRIMNVDISSVVINQMAQRSAESRPLMGFEVADITSMPQYEDSSFDVLIDKSTIDALLCGESSFLMTAKMLKEA